MARLNVQFFDRFDRGGARLAVQAYIVPDGVMSHDILLGTDSWRHFPRREYIDIGNDTCLLRLNNSAHSSGVSFSETTTPRSAYPKMIAAAAAADRPDFSDMIAIG